MKSQETLAPNTHDQYITKTHNATWWLIFQMQEVEGFVNKGSGIHPHAAF